MSLCVTAVYVTADCQSRAAQRRDPLKRFVERRSPWRSLTGMVVLSELSANEQGGRFEARKALAEAAAARKNQASKRLHTKAEAKALVKDAQMHEWIRKREKRGAQPKARMYFTQFRREALKACFESIDRDGNGVIDRMELIFALTQLGLDATHANQLLKEGDRDGDGSISMPEFFALVANASAREVQRETRRDPESFCTFGTTAAAPSAAAHGSLRDLVDRASTYPIGLLANAQQISDLVGSFDPEGYEARCPEYEPPDSRPTSRASSGRQGSHAIHRPTPSLATSEEMSEGGGSTPRDVELGRDGHLKLPLVQPTGGRATSAPLKSTGLSRWLQRAGTAKNSQQLLAAAVKPTSTTAHARPKLQRASSADIRTQRSRKGPSAPPAIAKGAAARPRSNSLPPLS